MDGFLDVLTFLGENQLLVIKCDGQVNLYSSHTEWQLSHQMVRIHYRFIYRGTHVTDY